MWYQIVFKYFLLYCPIPNILQSSRLETSLQAFALNYLEVALDLKPRTPDFAKES